MLRQQMKIIGHFGQLADDGWRMTDGKWQTANGNFLWFAHNAMRLCFSDIAAQWQ
jgi:hypothetical protein